MKISKADDGLLDAIIDDSFDLDCLEKKGLAALREGSRRRRASLSRTRHAAAAALTLIVAGLLLFQNNPSSQSVESGSVSPSIPEAIAPPGFSTLPTRSNQYEQIPTGNSAVLVVHTADQPAAFHSLNDQQLFAYCHAHALRLGIFPPGRVELRPLR